MKTIASFTVDHDRLLPGLYVSRKDGDVVTYDLRFIRPNTPPFLPNPVMHTIEHLAATYVRNSRFGDEIVYFGPMGCRTGFYLLVRDSVSCEQVIALVRETLGFIAAFEGTIPGTAPAECGNYREHDLAGAKAAAAKMLPVLAGWTAADTDYAAHGKERT